MSKWESKKLLEVAYVIRGVTFDKGDVSDSPSEGVVPILRAGNIGDKLDTKNDLVYVPAYKVGKEQLLQVGDVAICMSSGSPDIVGKTSKLEETWNGSVGAFCAIIRFNKNVLSRFGAIYFQSHAFISWRKQQAEGANIKNIRKSDLESLILPVPPLTEQERIVRILDEAEEMRRLRVQANTRNADLIPALFYEMFGDPVRNTNGFPTYKLKQLGRVTTGTTPPSVMEGMFGGDIPFITPGDLEIDTSNPKRYVTISGANESRVVRAGSTLVCCIGATIGKADIAKKSSAFNQQINAIEWKESVDDFYGLFCMRQFSHLIARLGGAFALPILKKSLFEEIEIPVPPITVQKEFSTRVKEIRSLEVDQSTAEQKLEFLFQSLLHRAFEGEL